MKLHHFVSGSSVILAGWLAVTFVYHLPAQRYLKSEKDLAAVPAKETSLVRAAPPLTEARVLPIWDSP